MRNASGENGMIVQAMPYPAATGGGSGDPHAGNVVLLTDYGDTNGGTTFTDKSASAHTLTRENNPTATTAVMLGGRPSLQLNGTNQRVSIPDSEDFYMSDLAFTQEGFFQTAADTAGTIMAQYTSTAFFRMNVNDSRALRGFYLNQATGADFSPICTLVSPISRTPHHWALCRQKANANSGASDTIYLYIDGVLQGSAIMPTTNADGRFRNGTGPLYLGWGDMFNPRWFNGYLGPQRWTKGVCRYPDGANFAVPASFPTS